MPTLAATLLAVMITAGCVDAGRETAHCGPVDPVVTPRTVAPGEELRVEVSGVAGEGCEPFLPDGARYSVEITSEVHTGDTDGGPYSAFLGDLNPGDDESAGSSFQVPADFPAGRAEVSVNLEGARTPCETDPTMSCPKDPFAPVEIVG